MELVEAEANSNWWVIQSRPTYYFTFCLATKSKRVNIFSRWLIFQRSYSLSSPKNFHNRIIINQATLLYLLWCINFTVKKNKNRNGSRWAAEPSEAPPSATVVTLPCLRFDEKASLVGRRVSIVSLFKCGSGSAVSERVWPGCVCSTGAICLRVGTDGIYVYIFRMR